MSSHPKVLVIGLDAAEPKLIRRWCQEGHLPNLERLMAAGTTTPLKSPAEQFPDEVWPAIYTSSNSAQLGKYYYIQPRPGSMNLELVEDRAVGEEFWIAASNHGKRCAVVDVPKTGLGPPIDGIQLVNWGSHATHAETASHPPELLRRVLDRHGPYPLHSCDSHGLKLEEYRQLRSQLIAGVALRKRVVEDLLASDAWDLFFCVFSETHCSGHQFWHLQDPNHPRYDPRDPYGLQTAMRDVYQAVDEAVGSIVEAAGPECIAVVFSGHGMQPQYHGRELLPKLLELWGMKGPSNVEPDPTRERRIKTGRSLLRKLKETVPMPWQYAVKKILPKNIEDALVCRFMGANKLDADARAFYVPNNDLTPAIRINIKGRDPQGLVAEGDACEELCEFISARLRELINPATGKPAVRKVSRTRDLYRGRHLEILPDLTAMWSDEAPIEALYSPGYGTVTGGHHDLRSGGHGAEGLLIIRDPAGRPIEAGEASGRDLAPSILELMGVPVPETMEGRSLVRAPELELNEAQPNRITAQ